MKRLLFAAAAAFTVGQAAATPVTVEFQATITEFYNAELFTPATFGVDMALQEVITGHFSYDSEAKFDYVWVTPDYTEFRRNGGFESWLTFPRENKIFEGGDLTMRLDERRDGVSLSLWGDFFGYHEAIFDFSKDGPYQPLNGYLPPVDFWSGFGGSMAIVERVLGYTPVVVLADIVSVRVIPSVPEPATYVMLGSGLGLSALTRKRKGRSDPKAA